MDRDPHIGIKVLQAGDENVLERVRPGVFDDPIHSQAAESFLNDSRHHLVVAMDEGFVVGFVSAVHYAHPDKPRPEMWINEVGVAPTHHRRGIATVLLNALLEVARGLGCAEAWVATERANSVAMRLYAGLGGTEEDCVMFTFDLSRRPPLGAVSPPGAATDP
jgi:GNAT superfamily N-acetyltransferase